MASEYTMVGREVALAEALAKLMIEPSGRYTVATSHAVTRPTFNGRTVAFEVELFEQGPRAHERLPLNRTARVEIIVRGPARLGDRDAG